MVIFIFSYYSEYTIFGVDFMKSVSKTLKGFLSVALEPVGSTMYIWGGGWNEDNTSAGEGAKHIGVSPCWREFFGRQNSSYNFKDHLLLHDCGLDCSGYVGWVMYNYMQRAGVSRESDNFVFKAGQQAKMFADMNLGTFTNYTDVTDFMPGDIMSSSNHVYIVVGSCQDGSLVLLHSSPPGVQLCGTYSKSGSRFSDGIYIAREYMLFYHTDWYDKFGGCIRDTSYLTEYSQFRWHLFDSSLMSDPDNLLIKSPREILLELA